MKRTGLGALVLLAIISSWLIQRRIDQAAPIPSPAAATPTLAPAESPADPLAGLVGEGLNAPDGTIERDLAIVDDLLTAWRTNFPGTGNPVGENHEITASLTGRNRLRLTLVPPDHPAINARGELIDRWGSPFIFHQISGQHMELRSAGPDRIAYTEDDSIWNPAPEPTPDEP